MRPTSASTPPPPIWTPVDWSRAWLAPLREVGQAIDLALVRGRPLCEALNTAGRAPVLFVPQAELPRDMAYERFIATTGRCPTREGLHDFFNALCWMHYPATKRRLNLLQDEQIRRYGVLPVRGAVRDALTVFDENAAFLSAPQPLWDALAAKQWQTLFGRLRPLWQDARLLLFGHALLEKLHAPRKGITAHVYKVDAATASLADVDAWVASDLDGAKLAAKPFAHLPVLGVPGWWDANEAPAFYDDTTVFRPPRAVATAVHPITAGRVGIRRRKP